MKNAFTNMSETLCDDKVSPQVRARLRAIEKEALPRIKIHKPLLEQSEFADIDQISKIAEMYLDVNVYDGTQCWEVWPSSRTSGDPHSLTLQSISFSTVLPGPRPSLFTSTTSIHRMDSASSTTIGTISTLSGDFTPPCLFSSPCSIWHSYFHELEWSFKSARKLFSGTTLPNTLDSLTDFNSFSLMVASHTVSDSAASHTV